jgi:hypothetical protein
MQQAKRPTRVNNTPALSFRLGEKHVDKMRRMAERRGTSMADLLRQWIDLTWEAENEARKRK